MVKCLRRVFLGRRIPSLVGRGGDMWQGICVEFLCLIPAKDNEDCCLCWVVIKMDFDYNTQGGKEEGTWRCSGNYGLIKKRGKGGEASAVSTCPWLSGGRPGK